MRKILLLFLPIFLFAFVQIGGENRIVPVQKAYQPSIKIEKDHLNLSIKMVDGVYLYKKYIHLKEIAPRKKEIALDFPPPLIEHGEEVFEKELRLRIPLTKLDSGRVTLELSYQGCSKAGICYPPQKREFTLHIPKTSSAPAKSENEDEIVSMLKHQGLGVILGSFFLFGLLLAFTPCIFPMIPILSSLIVGSKNMTTKKAFFYSLVYVLSMALTYTIAGVLAGLFGSNLQAAFQNPWVIGIFALVFVALALSMFGFYEIALPASWQTKLSKKSDEAGSKGGVVGIAVMGFLSALIVGPCVAPPLAGALIYIGQTADALLGGLALFVMSLGMGLPLLLVGTGAGKFMPKPGGWMVAVNKVFGVVMLGVAIWMLGRILPDSLTLLLWALLFIFSAVYLRTFEPIEAGAHWLNYFKKSLGMVLFIYGLFLFFGSFTGATSLIDPLSAFKHPAITNGEKRAIEFKKVSSLQELEKLITKAKKPVVVDFSAKWCTSCKELEETTFADPKVIKEFEHFVALRVDVTENSQEEKEMLKAFNLFGPPAILIFKNGKEVDRIIGYIDPKSLIDRLKEYE